MRGTIDRPFLVLTLVLVVVGFFLFCSASLGLMARNGPTFSSLALNQLLFGIGGGLVAMTILANVPYRLYKALAPYLFGICLVATLLVWVPGLSMSAGGATRWIHLGNLSVQPAEALKFGFVLGLAWLFSRWPKEIGTIKHGLVPYLVATAAASAVLLIQPDTGTFLVIAAAGAAMYVAAGARVAHLALLTGLFVCGVVVLVFARPYLMDRVVTFFNPSGDTRGSGYQLRQSMLAIGSGGLVGRGFGQSVQKFNYLPEPIGDSIFSVTAEEFGFLGGCTIIILFTVFTLRGLYIATTSRDRFGGLIVVGLVIIILTQSFANIGSMLGLIPLTGEPLVFISHGGSSLMFALSAVGIILNVSRTGTLRVVARSERTKDLKKEHSRTARLTRNVLGRV